MKTRLKENGRLGDIDGGYDLNKDGEIIELLGRFYRYIEYEDDPNFKRLFWATEAQKILREIIKIEKGREGK